MNESTPDLLEPADAEARLGQSPRGRAANDVVLALTRAARSFLLYDPQNEAIRQFLDALREAVDAYADVHGDLPLVVRPFELVLDGEVVYLDRDRERSLAFRLYRDGIRRLTLQPGTPWVEVLKLLEVLSIRFVGVRQAEDDLVVLLWKAGFQSITVEAVEGFVPEEDDDDDDEEIGDDEEERTAPKLEPEFDLPAPELWERGVVAHREVPPGARAALLAEDGMTELPGQCLQLVHELMRCAEDAEDPLSFIEIEPMLREIRDFVLSEGHLEVVLDMATRVSGGGLRDLSARERDGFLATFAEARAIGKLMQSVAKQGLEAPAELLALLEAVPGDHLRAVLGVLEHAATEPERRVARSLIEGYARKHSGRIVDQVQSSSPAVAAELLRALRHVDMDRAIEAVRQSTGRRDLDFESGALRVLEAAPNTAVVARLIVGYLSSTFGEVRIHAMRLVGARGVAAAFPVMLERVKRESLRGLSEAEAEAFGEALAGSDPVKAAEQFREWIKPRGFFTALAPPMLLWVAVSGLVHVPAADAEQLIKIAGEKGSAELQRYCTAAMVRRRRGGRAEPGVRGAR